MSGARDRRGRSPAKSHPAPAAPQRKWLWFRNERGGRKRAEEEFDALEATGRAGLAKKIERYIAGESRRQDVAHLRDGIYEIRHRVGNNHFRVLFIHWGPHCVGLTAFYKNQQQTPKADIDRAQTRESRWRTVFGKEPSG